MSKLSINKRPKSKLINFIRKISKQLLHDLGSEVPENYDTEIELLERIRKNEAVVKCGCIWIFFMKYYLNENKILYK